jgi:uncharacterized SAM-binding protein YcdF (DUF218 family)
LGRDEQAARTAIVVLGCKVEPDGNPSPALERRADWGAAAFEAGLGVAVIAAGGRRWSGHAEAAVVARRLAERGVPSAAIFPELSSMTTAENALFTVELAKGLGLTRLVLVTCSFHLPRALGCFRASGANATGFGAPSPPSALAVSLWRRVHERCAEALDVSYLGAVARARARGLHPFDASTE